MVGFGLDGYQGRIPCPHCGSTDCCGIDGDKQICITTKKPVTAGQLIKSAKKHGIKSKAESMIFTAKTIEQVKAENPGLGIVEQYQKHATENWTELKRIDAEAKTNGTILHRYIKEPVADGLAIYQIVKLNKKSVKIRHCTGFSDYMVSYWGTDALINRDYAEGLIRQRDTLDELFSKKEVAQ